jgi:hypothetical protein
MAWKKGPSKWMAEYTAPVFPVMDAGEFFWFLVFFLLTYILQRYIFLIRKQYGSCNASALFFTSKEVAMDTKIFVRERHKSQEGEKQPRFRVVGVSGGDLKIHLNHMRQQELDQIAEITGASIVYLAHHGDKTGKHT